MSPAHWDGWLSDVWLCSALSGKPLPFVLLAFVVHEPGGTAARPSANGLSVDAKVLEMLWLFVCLVSSGELKWGSMWSDGGAILPFREPLR